MEVVNHQLGPTGGFVLPLMVDAVVTDTADGGEGENLRLLGASVSVTRDVTRDVAREVARDVREPHVTGLWSWCACGALGLLRVAGCVVSVTVSIPLTMGNVASQVQAIVSAGAFPGQLSAEVAATTSKTFPFQPLPSQIVRECRHAVVSARCRAT